MSTLRTLLAALLLALCAGGARAQDADSTMTRLLVYMKHAMMFNAAMPQEKAYLHFDNTGYFKGETMRFKAYVVRADNGLPTDISRVLYVEMLNPSGDVVETRKLRVADGQAEGDFQLDSIFGTGFYEVRAFTRYMTNWGGNGIFSRVFPVFKKPEAEGDYSAPRIEELTYLHRLPNGREALAETEAGGTKPPRRARGGLAVAFYPEGGHLVRGLRSRVAFSVSGRDGRHAAVKALLVNAAGESVEFAQSGENGRGTFDVTPDGQPLTLVATDAEGKRHEFALPQARDEGCVVRLDALGDDNISATVMASPGTCGRLLGYTLVSGGNVVVCDTLTAEPAVELLFERAKMRAGVSQLTVFDSGGRILAERLFFVCPPPSGADSIRVAAPQAGLKPCGRVRIDLTAAPGASFSFSAMDAATLTNGKVGNARTWMLLGSEVRGYIENPDYYLEADDREHRAAADLLMMVQGWRRYDWRLQAGLRGFDQLEGNTGKIQQIEDKLYVFGQLRPDTFKFRRKRPVGGVSLDAFLYNRRGEHLQGHTTTDSLGNYAFELPDITGEWNMQIRTRYNDKNTAYVVAIDRHFSPAARTLSPYETEMIPLPGTLAGPRQAAGGDAGDGTPRLGGQGRSTGYVLPTVKVRGRYFTSSDRLPWYDERTGARKSSVYYNLDEATDRTIDEGKTLPTLFAWLKEKNEFFGGDDHMEDRWTIVDDTTGELRRAADASVDTQLATDYSKSVFRDGPTYKNRPIVWMVNNTYCTVSQYTRNTYNIRWTSNTSGATTMPDFIDEVKSVYISEDDDNYTRFIHADELAALHPVTVFVYTHPQFFNKEKGLRRTHFQGYNEPTAFEMEDYSLMPPMADFRRTLYWQPTVRADASGRARVEFFNNSSCTQMYISAEGFTPQGHFVVSE